MIIVMMMIMIIKGVPKRKQKRISWKRVFCSEKIFFKGFSWNSERTFFSVSWKFRTSFILSCEEQRLIKKVFLAQEMNPVKNDWCLQVKYDLKLFKLDYLSFKNIKSMKKEHFRALVKLKCKQVAFEDLLTEKESKNKIKNINYPSLQIQSYLMSSQINLRRKKLILN